MHHRLDRLGIPADAHPFAELREELVEVLQEFLALQAHALAVRQVFRGLDDDLVAARPDALRIGHAALLVHFPKPQHGLSRSSRMAGEVNEAGIRVETDQAVHVLLTKHGGRALLDGNLGTDQVLKMRKHLPRRPRGVLDHPFVRATDRIFGLLAVVQLRERAEQAVLADRYQGKWPPPQRAEVVGQEEVQLRQPVAFRMLPDDAADDRRKRTRRAQDEDWLWRHLPSSTSKPGFRSRPACFSPPISSKRALSLRLPTIRPSGVEAMAAIPNSAGLS